MMCFNFSDQHRDLCKACQKELPISLTTCVQCGLALPKVDNVSRCGQCIKHPPHFDQTIIGFNYQAPVDTWIKQFKFHKKGLYARILTEIFAEKLADLLENSLENKPQFLIPVPLHWRRMTARGFNQAYIITKYLSKKLQIPILPHRHVRRIVHTPAQSHLHRNARKLNLKKAFSVQDLPKIQHAAVIDDVFTTGSTVNALVKQLKKHGVVYVSVWALARAQ